MKVISLDHLVVNVKDVDAALRFYGDVLGLEVLRLDQFRQGKVGFVSVRASEGSLIDLRPSPSLGRSSTHASDNIDHFCLILEPTDMQRLLDELRSQGLRAEGPVSPRWGARGNGPSFYTWDPDGNKIELKCYAGI